MAIVMKCNDNFQKRANDCSFPTSWNYQFTCWIKEDCSVVNPTMIIDRVAFDTWLSENPGRGRPVYCQIEDYGRYYFVRDFRYNKSLIEIDLECDVLATYRADITNERHYVLRAASQFNTYIPDTMYPAQSNIDLLGTPIVSPWEQTFNDGCVSFGIVGSGATNYYLMSYNDFTYFIHYLLSDDYMSDVLGSFALSAYPQYKLVVDPLQYLSSVMWIPLKISAITASGGSIIDSVSSIRVGSVNVAFSDVSSPAITGYRIQNAVYRHTWSCGTLSNTYTLYKHPDSASRGEYLNCAPWTQIQVYYPPFGVIDIDTVQLGLFKSTSTRGVWLQLTTDVDLRTGSGTLTVYRFETNPSGQQQVLTSINSQIGIQFEIGQVIAPGYGVSSQIMFGASVASDVAGVAASVSYGNPAGAIQGAAGAVTNVVTGIGNIIQSRIPMARSIGGTGGFDALKESPHMVYQFYHPSGESRAELGRVLCQETLLGNLQGYILCKDANTSAGKTLDEKEKINYFLNTGFFNGDFNP